MPLEPVKSASLDLFALRMIQLRHKREWSQETLAQRSGFHRTFIARIENKTTNPTLTSIERIANALNVPLTDLLSIK
jgi:transcriptional regulator with XRE-family HTH domain